MTLVLKALALVVLVLAVCAASTPWSGTYSATVTATAPALVGCADTEVSLRLANLAAACLATGPNAPNGNTTWGCYVSAQDTVQLRLCCVSAVCTTSSKSYLVTVKNP